MFLTVLGLVAPFILKDDSGRPLLNLHDLQAHQGAFKQSILQTRDWLSALLKKAETQVSQTQQQTQEHKSEQSSSNQVYKWRDEQGQWQFSDQAPAHTQAEMLTFNPNENILPATSPTSSANKNTPTHNAEPTESIKKTDTSSLIPGLPTLEQAKKIMEDAKKVQGLSDQHAKELEKY